MSYINNFSDNAITKAIAPDPVNPGYGLWYAVIDVGYELSTGTDFSSSGKTKDEAVKHCASEIRQSALGIGKFSPKSFLKEETYEFKYQLLPHWQIKHAVEELEFDTHEFVNIVDDAIRLEPDRWSLDGHHLSVWGESRLLESHFQLAMLSLARRVEIGENLEEEIGSAVDAIRTKWSEGYRRTRSTKQTWSKMEELLSADAIDFSFSQRP